MAQFPIHASFDFSAHCASVKQLSRNSTPNSTLPRSHCEIGHRGRGLVAALSVGIDAFVIDADFHLVQCPISKIYQSLGKDNDWICTDL